MDNSELRNRIRSLICDNVAPEIDYAEVSDDAGLISDLNLDSLQILGLITELEREFEFTLDDEDLDLQALASVSTVAGFVEKKLAG